MKKTSLVSISAFLVCSFLLVGCSNTKNGDQVKEINKIDGVIFSVPQNWKEQKADDVPFGQLMEVGKVVQFSFDKQGSAQVIPFTLAQGLSQNPRNVLMIMENQIINNVSVENKVIEDVKIGEKDGVRLSFGFNQDGVQKFCDSYIVLNDKTAYLIIFKNDIDKIDETTKNIKTILDSFKFV